MVNTQWRDIPGYAYPYRISDQGEVQQLRNGQWRPLSISITRRAEVHFRLQNGKQCRKGVFRLLDEYFNGGYARKHGLCVGPKNGFKSECTLDNLGYKTHEEIGRCSFTRSAKKAVIRRDRAGNEVIYSSMQEAARKSGLTPQSLDRRIYRGVLDPRGYTWEIVDGRT